MALLTLKFISNPDNKEYSIIEFDGELDKSTIPNAELQIENFLVKSTQRFVVFNLSALKYANSEGVGFFVSTHTKLTHNNKQLVLFGLIANVADVFDAIGIGKLIPTFKNLDEVVSFVSKK